MGDEPQVSFHMENAQTPRKAPEPRRSNKTKLGSPIDGNLTGPGLQLEEGKEGLMKVGLLACLRTITAVFIAIVCSVTCYAAEPPAGALVAAIQTATGNYLTAVNGGGLGGPDTGPSAVALHTDATKAGPRETFTIVWLNSTYTQFALQTSDGHYVMAVNGGGVGGPNDSSAPIHTDAKTIGIWETLTFNFLPNNQLTIQVPKGQFLSAVNGGGIIGPAASPIHTDATRLAQGETFALVKLEAASASARKGPPDDADAGQKGLNQDVGKCFERSLRKTNPDYFYLKWKCPPLFDPKIATPDSVTQVALDFLTKYADVWQLENPTKELKRRYAQPNWEVEFSQWNGGVPVFEAGIHVSFARGVPFCVQSDYVPGLDSLNKRAKLSGVQANEVARKHLATLVKVPVDAIFADDKPTMGISAARRNEPARPPRLVYHLTLAFSGRVATAVYGYGAECEIDAHTGEVVSENYLRPLSASPVR